MVAINDALKVVFVFQSKGLGSISKDAVVLYRLSGI
jgi:hypothetical protein